MKTATNVLALLRQAAQLRNQGDERASDSQHCKAIVLLEQMAADEAARAAPPPWPRDAVIYFRAGKLLAVETAAGTFTLADLKERGLIAGLDGMILAQVAQRVDTLVRQLGAAS